MVAKDAALSGLTVLIIEDEFLIAADVQRIVEDAGAGQTLLANSTATARAHINGERPIDIAILDLKLGSEDGLPLAGDLRDRAIPFVVATGFGGDFEVDDTVIIQKPYDDRAVLEALLKVREDAENRRARA